MSEGSLARFSPKLDVRLPFWYAGFMGGLGIGLGSAVVSCFFWGLGCLVGTC